MPIKRFFPKVGDTFGKWILLDDKPKTKRNQNRYLLCKCKCGLEKWVNMHELYTGNTKQCSKCRGEKQSRYISETGKIPKKLFTHWKALAKYRKIPFELTHQYLEDLLNEQDFKCKLSGTPFMIPNDEIAYEGLKSEWFDYSANTLSLDRVDSSVPYIMGNVQFIHKVINICKGALTDEVFIKMCNAVAYNHPMNVQIFDYVGKTAPQLVKSPKTV